MDEKEILWRFEEIKNDVAELENRIDVHSDNEKWFKKMLGILAEKVILCHEGKLSEGDIKELEEMVKWAPK